MDNNTTNRVTVIIATHTGSDAGLEVFTITIGSVVGEVSLAYDTLTCELGTWGESEDYWASPAIIAALNAADAERERYDADPDSMEGSIVDAGPDSGADLAADIIDACNWAYNKGE